jgi:hypothetical protein
MSNGMGAPRWLVPSSGKGRRQLPGKISRRCGHGLDHHGLLAATDPWKYRFVFDMLVLIGIFMVGVHLYGFVKKNQPLIEH